MSKRMRARGRRDTTQRLVREMHETLGKLVTSNNAIGEHLRTLTAQTAVLGVAWMMAAEVEGE